MAPIKGVRHAREDSRCPLVDSFANRQRTKPAKLDAIDMMIDWRPVVKKLGKALKRTANALGNPAYSAFVLFKELVLQRMYNIFTRVRCGIERNLGTFKRCHDFARSRYVRQAKIEQELFLVDLSYNLVRARTLCLGEE